MGQPVADQDPLVRNPFLVGTVVLTTIFFAVLRFGSSAAQAATIRTWKWLVSGAVLFGGLIGVNLMAISPGPLAEIVDNLPVLFALAAGLVVVVMLRLLTGYWSVGPAIAILVAAAGILYAQQASRSVATDKLIPPLSILSQCLLAGWWFVRRPLTRAR